MTTTTTAFATVPSDPLAGYCVACASLGQHSEVARPGASLCQYHLRTGAPSTSPRRPARPANAPTPGQVRKPGPKRRDQSWRRMFLHASPIAKAPRATGSQRRLSPGRMVDHAALLAVQARSAHKAPRPAAWLACVLYDLENNRPAGASRSDARDNIYRIAATMAVSGDWGSGRRSRPGRQVAAAITGRAERTVERHLQLLEGRDLARREIEGKLLTAEQRATNAQDDDVSPDQRLRWADRAEWTLTIPDWVRDITDEQIAPYVPIALALIDDLAAPTRPSDPVDNDGGKAVDNCPGQTPRTGSVAPSTVLKVISSLPVRRGSFSQPVPVEKPVAAPSPVTPEKPKEPKGGASRPSPTERGPLGTGTGRRLDPQALSLARQALTDSRLGFLAGADLYPTANVLTRLAQAGWGVDDLVAEINLRLTECHKTLLDRADRPASYLKWLLSHAVPGEPPAQIAAALEETAREIALAQATARQRDWDDAERRRLAGRTGDGRRQALAMAERITEQRRQERLAEAAGRPDVDDLWTLS